MAKFDFKSQEQLNQEISKILSGDFQGYEQFYTLSVKFVYKLILDITKDTDITSKLTTKVYEEINNRFYEISEPSQFKLWAVKISTDITYSYLKENKPEILTLYSLPEMQAQVTETLENDMEQIVPQGYMANDEFFQAVNEMVGDLAPIDVIIVQYYYYLGMSISQIEGILGIDRVTLQGRVAYVKATLKNIIFETTTDTNSTVFMPMGKVSVLWTVFMLAADNFTFADSGRKASAVLGTAGMAKAAGALGEVSAANGAALSGVKVAKEAGAIKAAAVGANSAKEAAAIKSAALSANAAKEAAAIKGAAVGASKAIEGAAGASATAGTGAAAVGTGTAATAGAGAAGAAATAGASVAAKVAIAAAIVAVGGGGAAGATYAIIHKDKEADNKTEEGTNSQKDSKSLVETYYDYLENQIIPEKGLASCNEITGIMEDYSQEWYTGDTGVISAYVKDLDGDDQEEMLVIYSEEETSKNEEYPGFEYKYMLYSNANGKADCTDEGSFSSYSWDYQGYEVHNDATIYKDCFYGTDFIVSDVESTDGDYIMVEFPQHTDAFADGFCNSYWGYKVIDGKLCYACAYSADGWGSVLPNYYGFYFENGEYGNYVYYDPEVVENINATITDYYSSLDISSVEMGDTYGENGESIFRNVDGVTQIMYGKTYAKNTETGEDYKQIVTMSAKFSDYTDMMDHISETRK